MAVQNEIQKVKIGRKSYPVKLFNEMNRREARFLRETAERANSQDIEALWDLLAAVVPTAPQDEIDELAAEQVEEMLRDAKIIAGTITEAGGVTLGESAASTDS